MNRKSFLTKVSAALLTGIPLLSLWNCSDNSEDDPEPEEEEEDDTSDDTDDTDDNNDDDSTTSCIDNGTSSSISANHGHSLTVSKADVSAGVNKTYDITGQGDHSHSVTVTADNFASLMNNNSVTVQSTSSGHTHSVTISCA